MKYEIKKIYKDKYPEQLKQISRLPTVMDMVGNLPDETYKFLCVIGSRKYTSYGSRACEKIISGLHGYPIAIVSGLAIGIDSLAHEAALRAEMKTVAFPGSGLSPRVLYPPSRKNLANKIIASGGCLISPFEYEQGSQNWTFPTRNRLMAGISHAVLVIEGGHGSGTLLTAGYASEFGRDVFAVPGSIFEEQTYGPHMLIRDSAAIITNADDVLRALGFESSENKPDSFLNIAELSLCPEERRIIAALQFAPSDTTTILENISLSVSEFNIHVSRLELLGVVTKDQNVYRIKR